MLRVISVSTGKYGLASTEIFCSMRPVVACTSLTLGVVMVWMVREKYMQADTITPSHTNALSARFFLLMSKASPFYFSSLSCTPRRISSWK